MEALPPADILGSWLVGTCIELWFMGVLAGQFVKYFELFGKSDPRWLHIYISGLAFLSVVKSCVNFAVLWHKTIILFGDLDDTAPMGTDVRLSGVVAMLVVSCVFYVQGYYLHRLFLISNNNAYLVAPIAVLLFVGWLLSIVADGLYVHGGGDELDEVSTLYYVHFPLVITGDVILTLATAFFLLRFRRNVLAPSASVLTTLIRLTFQTAAPATMTIIANLVVGVTFPHNSQVISGINIVLGKLWVFSLMWTLNARADKGSKMRSVYTSRPASVETTTPTGTGTQTGLMSSIAFRREYDPGVPTRSLIAVKSAAPRPARTWDAVEVEITNSEDTVSDMEVATPKPSRTQVRAVSGSDDVEDGRPERVGEWR